MQAKEQTCLGGADSFASVRHLMIQGTNARLELREAA